MVVLTVILHSCVKEGSVREGHNGQILPKFQAVFGLSVPRTFLANSSIPYAFVNCAQKMAKLLGFIGLYAEEVGMAFHNTKE